MADYTNISVLTERITSERLNNLLKLNSGDDSSSFLTNLIERAESLVNAYAATRYKIPLPKNSLAEEWTLSIAEYELYKRGSSPEVPAKIKESYENALSMLKDLAAAKIQIPSAETATAVSSYGTSFTVASNHPMMEEKKLRGF